jgi:hypothetical protein
MHQSNAEHCSSSFAAVVDPGAYGIAAHQPGIVGASTGPIAILRDSSAHLCCGQGASEFDGPPQPPLRESGRGQVSIVKRMLSQIRTSHLRERRHWR